MNNVVQILVCVGIISAGQVLFRWIGIYWRDHGTILAAYPLAVLFAAFALYGAATLLWVNVLRNMELARAYSYMSLCFVIVPLASYLLFGERFSAMFYLGMFLIITGLITVARA